MRNYFTFGSITSTSYGVYITGTGVYNAPERSYESITVPGRDGALLGVEKQLLNIELTYPAFISSNFKTNMSDFKAALLSQTGYQRLTDTYYPTEFRKAVYRGGMEVDARTQHDAGQFDITFECKPQRYLVSGESAVMVASGGTLTNPTKFPSQPLIRVTGYGTLYVNSDKITVASGNTYVDIDCETMDCYYGTTNANSYVTFQNTDFPVLKSGSNSFTYSGNITALTITPRWWTV